MKVIRDINYAGDDSQWHLGDLYIPEGSGPFPLALCIHGGGWSSLDRYSVSGIAEYMASQGFAIFNIEYRLLGIAPWPACGDDCLAAANFLLNGGAKEYELQFDKLFVVGGSAGGHLSLMTGLRLPREKVSGIVSISGISSMEFVLQESGFSIDCKKFWGYEPSASEIKAASPLDLIKAGQAPVLCTHCPVDTVVEIEHSTVFVEKCLETGAEAEIFEYDRPCDGHCIWIPCSDPHKLYPEIEEAVINFARRVHK